jgi:hypothetical protein
MARSDKSNAIPRLAKQTKQFWFQLCWGENLHIRWAQQRSRSPTRGAIPLSVHEMKLCPFYKGAFPLTISWLPCAVNDLHRFDPATSTWIEFSGKTTGLDPPPISCHGMVSVGQSIYSFGGSNIYGNRKHPIRSSRKALPFFSYIQSHRKSIC